MAGRTIQATVAGRTGRARSDIEAAVRATLIQEKRVERAFERPVAIVKSGVIDGMAFTVYVDGSIEAELPQGIIKFASLDALRAHLQKRS